MPAAKGSARTPLGPILATFVYASSQGQRTHSAQNKIKLHKYMLLFETYTFKAQLSFSSFDLAGIKSLAMMNSLKSRYPFPSVSRVLQGKRKL